MRHAARVDSNQKTIVSALRACGVKVAITSALGDGYPDLTCAHHGRVVLIECKLKGEKLTPDQVRFHADFPVCVVRSVDDALLVLGINPSSTVAPESHRAPSR
jgi:hypothetical protein